VSDTVTGIDYVAYLVARSLVALVGIHKTLQGIANLIWADF
jgi:hypothetical protein